MNASLSHKCLLVLLLGLGVVALSALGSPDLAVATDEYMLRLPAYSKFSCQNCHTSPTPTVGASALNAFGADFSANGLAWNVALAVMNSDGDKCTNGFELGDQDGDGRYDFAGEPVENSNPATPDCTLPVREQTWGIIKDIFSNEIRQYQNVLNWDGGDVYALYFP